jgi:hypothetical protein
MKKWVISTTAALFLSAATTSMISAAPQVHVRSADQAITGYFDAAKNGKIDTMVQLSKDVTYTDTDAEIDGLTGSYQNNPLVDYKILSKNNVDATHVDFTVQATYKNTSDLPPLTYRAFEENGDWKVLIEPIEINKVEGSPDFGKVTKSNKKLQKSQTTGVLNPEVDVIYWSFSDLQSSNSILGANYFGQIRNDRMITLNGVQSEATPDGSAYMTYEVVKVSGNTTTSYVSEDVNGKYPDINGNFNGYCYSLPYSSSKVYQMRFTNNGYYNVKASGNGYE